MPRTPTAPTACLRGLHCFLRTTSDPPEGQTWIKTMSDRASCRYQSPFPALSALPCVPLGDHSGFLETEIPATAALRRPDNYMIV
jgi:hypothetical protein